MEVIFSRLECFWTLMVAIAGSLGLAGLFLNDLLTSLGMMASYGKAGPQTKDLRNRYARGYFSVPKRWFTHFYVWATLTSEVALMLSLMHISRCKMYDYPPVQMLDRFLSFIRQPAGSLTINDESIPASLNQATVVLCTFLFFVHSTRRFYESGFISIYSNSKMNLMHYILGMVHYLMVPCSILAEGTSLMLPPFTDVHDHKEGQFSFTVDIIGQFTLIQWISIALFLYASLEQHWCFRTLASLRRRSTGEVYTFAHSIPHGGWFEYVACPHFMFEILIYVSLWFCQGLSWNTWVYILTFVVVNQSMAAWITKDWYVRKFAGLYPKDRAALIPYVF